MLVIIDIYLWSIHTKIVRKICLIIFLVVAFFLLKLQSSYAQDYPTYNNVAQETTPLTEYVPPSDLHYRTQNVMIEVMSAFTCQIAGFDPVNPEGKCLGINTETKKIGFVENNGGMMGLAGNLLGMTFNIPVSSNEYFADLGSRFGIVKPAYAQGAGFAGLEPVMKMWKAFRDVVYLLFVIIFVLVGLGIMFRIQIDQRTVMSIQNQIPKIIITLILVTFSYAIAGLLIDLMWIAMYLLFLIVQSTGVDVMGLNPASAYGRTTFEVANNGFGGIHGLASNVALSVKDIMANIIKLDTSPLTAINPAGFMGIVEGTKFVIKPDDFSFSNWIVDLISSLVGLGVGAKAATIADVEVFGFNLTGAPTGLAAGYLAYSALEASLRWLIPYLITFLIVFVALLWALFRLWFQLLKAYVFILMDVIFAPFWIAAGVIPGVTTGFGSWLRDMLANLSAFPVALGMFLIGKVFLIVFSVQNQDPFLPPLLGNPGDPRIFGSIIALGIILMTPEVVTMTRDAFKAPGLKYPAIIGKAIGVGQGAGSAFTGGIGKQFWRTDNMGAPKGLLNTYLYTRFKARPMLGTLFGSVLGGWRAQQGTEDVTWADALKSISRRFRGGRPTSEGQSVINQAQNPNRMAEAQRRQQARDAERQNSGGGTA